MKKRSVGKPFVFSWRPFSGIRARHAERRGAFGGFLGRIESDLREVSQEKFQEKVNGLRMSLGQLRKTGAITGRQFRKLDSIIAAKEKK